DVEVAERLLAPARAAGLRDLDRCRMPPEHGDDREQRVEPVAEQPAVGRLLRLLGGGLQDPLFRLGAEACERAQLLLLGRTLELVDGGDAELLPDPRGGLRAEPR